MILGLVIGVMVLIFLVLRTKIHAFLAYHCCLVNWIDRGDGSPGSIEAITSCFGGTLGSIRIVIGFGVMMGRILEVSGAAERLAYSFLKWLGRHKEDWAMALTGYVVSIPIFVDSAICYFNTIS